jgi:hypothetical protein
MVSMWRFLGRILKCERRTPATTSDSGDSRDNILDYNFVICDILFAWRSGVDTVVRRFINSKNERLLEGPCGHIMSELGVSRFDSPGQTFRLNYNDSLRRGHTLRYPSGHTHH